MLNTKSKAKQTIRKTQEGTQRENENTYSRNY